MRKLIIIGVGILILAGSFLLFNTLKNSKKKPHTAPKKVVKTAYVKTAENTTIPVIISANGSLIAKNRMELYSEVTGVLQTTAKPFKEGTYYSKGQTLLRINNEEAFASLQAQKSTLQNLIASIMPDVRLDYPNAFTKWQGYLQRFDIHKSVEKLPEPTSDKEKYFITGKNIYTNYYNIKNAEARLAKYRIRAPYNGVLTQSLVTNGTLVRAGQKLGEFINTSVYELALSVNAQFATILRVGKKVKLTNLDKTKSWQGQISRINGVVDATSQTIQIFIDVKGKELREGMYLHANVPTKNIENAMEISQKLLVNNKAIYIVKDNVLEQIPVNPIYFNEDTAIITGVPNGVLLVSKPITGAYNGMPVTVNK